jgi:hypothetical protein
MFDAREYQRAIGKFAAQSAETRDGDVNIAI